MLNTSFKEIIFGSHIKKNKARELMLANFLEFVALQETNPYPLYYLPLHFLSGDSIFSGVLSRL